VHILVPILVVALATTTNGYRIDKHIQPIPEHSLQSDLMEFIDLIPQEDINQLTKHYYINDPEIRSTYNFLASIDFKIIRAKIFQLPEVRELMEYFGNCGLNVMEIMDRLSVIMQPPKVSGGVSGKSR
jgi:Insect allergen related repeat, nitrile-specifier detoxification